MSDAITDPPTTRGFYALTDAGNAEYFAHREREALRYDHRRRRWLLWDTHYWAPDRVEEVQQRAKWAMRNRLRDAADIEDTDARARASKHAVKSESRAGLTGLLSLAQSEPPLADAGDQWDEQLWLLGVPNGVLDLRTGLLRPGERADRVTMQARTPFDGAAECPRWEQFLVEVFHADADLLVFMHRAIGYSLTGDTSEQCLFMGYGNGSNGKGTLMNTLAAVLGDYAWNMPFSTIEKQQNAQAIPNDLAALVGRRFVTAGETNDGTRLNEARVKALTGSDPITARFLHAEFFTFQPRAKFWLAVNHKPVVRDDSFGFWRRMRLIPFTQQFPIDAGLSDTLRAEAPGILAWAVRGCLDWQRYGLATPPSVLAATDSYAAESDPLADFLSECARLGPDERCQASVLFEGYSKWADRRKLTVKERLTATSFGRKMSDRFTKYVTNSGTFYDGIDLSVVGYHQ